MLSSGILDFSTAFELTQSKVGLLGNLFHTGFELLFIVDTLIKESFRIINEFL